MNEDIGISIKYLTVRAAKALRNNKHKEAIMLSTKLLELEPDHVTGITIAFTSFFKTQQFEQARLIGNKAAKLNPTSEFILNNQACLQLEAKRPAKAAELINSLIEKFGEKPQWMYNLGLAQRMDGHYQDSISTFQHTLLLDPEHDKAAFQLTELYRLTGQLELACRQLNYLRQLRPRDVATHSQYIHQSCASGEFSPTEFAQEMTLWGKRFALKRAQYPATEAQRPEQLKIGFIIGTISHRWWAAMIAPVINELAKSDAIIIYWHDTNNKVRCLEDTVEVHNCSGLTDTEFGQKVRNDQIDTLVDVYGMQPGCRQRVLGLQVANQQFGWLTHQGAYATKRVALIEDDLDKKRFCFDLIDDFDEASATQESKTLFALNTARGLSETTIQVWAKVLTELSTWPINLDATQPAIQNQLRHGFKKHQINASRLLFDSERNPGKGDVVLENLTNNDVVSAYSALRRGAVVVALSGDLFPAQQCSALLAQLGRNDLIANNHSDYVSKAVELINKGGGKPTSNEQFKRSQLHNMRDFAARIRKVLSHD